MIDDKSRREIMHPEAQPLPTVWEEKPAVDYQELSNLACWLDVVSTIIAGHDEWNKVALFSALLEGARYNGADIDDLAEELSAALLPEKPATLPVQQICADLTAASTVLSEQLVLALMEQRITKAKRI